MRKRIKVVFFIDRFRIGGMHRQILYLVRNINLDLFEPIVITQTKLGGLYQEFNESGCKLIDLNWKGKWNSLAVLYRLIKVLYFENPNIVFISQPPILIYYRLARLFWRKKVVQIGSFRAMTFWLGHKNIFLNFIDKILSNYLIKSSDHIVVNSYLMKEHYIRTLGIEDNLNFDVIYNGSDFHFPITKSVTEMRADLCISSENKIVVMIARLDPWKDFNTFLEAAAIVLDKIQSVKFIIVGEGVLRSSIEMKINELKLNEYVYLVGERQDAYNFINLADITVLSTHGEGFSNSILESMALSTPVIATAVGGNVELIGESGEYGILVSPKSPKELANAIYFLINNDSERHSIAIKAKERIYDICSIQKFTSTYEQLFYNSLKNNSRK